MYLFLVSYYYLIIHKGICKLRCSDTIYVIILVISKYKVVIFFFVLMVLIWIFCEIWKHADLE